jgi:hypothetical protein
MSKSIHIIPMTDTMCLLVVQALKNANLESYDQLLANRVVETIEGIVSADRQVIENGSNT